MTEWSEVIYLNEDYFPTVDLFSVTLSMFASFVF